MDLKIEFSSPLAGDIDHPKPSLSTIPDEYKKLSIELDKRKFDYTESSVKGCMPFLDAYTIGYTLTAPIEFGFQIIKENQHFHFKLILPDLFPKEALPYFNLENHNNQQVPEKLRSSYRTIDVVFKLLFPWKIKTPPGYSCIFTNPLNKNSPIKIIDGVVDTDSFHQVNFPFYWTGDINKELTIIQKGTPLIQVIPFKRENWKMSVKKSELDTYREKMKLSQFLKDNYKKLFWKKKSFK